MSLVSLVKNEDTNYESIKRSILHSLNLINFDFNSKIKNIIIKPNMCYYNDPSTGLVTDPLFVNAIIDVFRDQISPDIHAYIVESDASAMKCNYAFKILGYYKLLKNNNITLINLTEQKSKKIDLNINGKLYNFLIPQIVLESDLFINVPKIKYMEYTKITCALKNIFGCNAYSKKSKYHKILNEAIIELNKHIKTDLVIVDGIIVCGLHTKRLGLVMASNDPVAIDAAASKIAGLNPKTVKTIKLAQKDGIGNHIYIEVGEKLSYFSKNFPKKRTKDKIKNLLNSIYNKYISYIQNLYRLLKIHNF